MYKKITLTFITLITIQWTIAQTKYYSGFDNASQLFGWTQYRKGDLGNYNFNISSNNAYSPLDCLSHDYPVGGSIATIDWYVSKEFNFSLGGKIDSLRFNFSGFGSPGNDDTVAIYLLVGSQDPNLATNKIVLHDFRDTNYKRTGNWEKLTNINIPNTSGKTYLAFKYKTVNNWLTVKFDNLALTQNANTSIKMYDNYAINIYPNPTKGFVYINSDILNDQNNYTIKIYDNFGKLVLEKMKNDETQLDISNFVNGIYHILLIDNENTILYKSKLIINND